MTGSGDFAAERPAGAGHANLALRQEFNGPPRNTSQYYGILTETYSEEEKRQFLLAGERKRRGSHLRHARTDTLGLGLPLAPADYQGTIRIRRRYSKQFISGMVSKVPIDCFVFFNWALHLPINYQATYPWVVDASKTARPTKISLLTPPQSRLKAWQHSVDSSVDAGGGCYCRVAGHAERAYLVFIWGSLARTLLGAAARMGAFDCAFKSSKSRACPRTAASACSRGAVRVCWGDARCRARSACGSAGCVKETKED